MAAAPVNGISTAATAAAVPSLPSDYELRFGGVGRLYAGDPTDAATNSRSSRVVLDRLRNAAVMIVGVGGVGSWAAEAIGRSGVGTIVLVDLDDVCISNTNRQLPALRSTVGQLKLEVLRERLRQINPECRVILMHDFVMADNVQGIFRNVERQLNSENDDAGENINVDDDTRRRSRITAVIDAIDGAPAKAALLATCSDRAIPVVTCGGAAGCRDLSKIVRRDITVIQNDKLLAATKKYMRKHYGFPPGLPFRELQKGRKVQKWYVDGVYSEELLVANDAAADTDDNSGSSLRQCDGALGTACFVTGTFGFAAASAVIERIALDQLRSPRKRRR